MVAPILNLVTDYEERQRKQYVPRFSYGRCMLRDDGGSNRLFLNYLFTDQAMTIQFPQELGLLRSKGQCNTCGRDMQWFADSNLPEGFCWRCEEGCWDQV